PGEPMLFDYGFWSDSIPLEDPARRAAMLYTMSLLLTAVVVLGIRYYTSSGPEKNTSKHLIAAIIGPVLFAGSFWISSRQTGPSYILSPSIVLAFISQLGLIAVLRQEEIQNPRLLSRIVFYGALVLASFLLINLVSELYVYVQGRIVMDNTVTWMLIGAILVFFLIARLSLAERTFDELMFHRAAEYRRLIEETRMELRDARERLLRSEKLSAVGELAARVAHEIKNPLGPIKGYTQMMRDKLEADTEFRHRDEFLHHLEVIAEEVENIDRRVRQFLNASRQPQLMIETTNVNRIVDRCGRILNLEIAATGELPTGYTPVAVRVQLDENAKDLEADSGKIEEAIFNLARNALDAVNNESGGYIRMKTARQFRDGEEGILVTVQDSGPGFPADGIDQLFEPFYSRKSGGTGLGLAIVKSAIEAHGGTIELGNRKEGGGEALVWLPYHRVLNPGALLPKA
ncbi:MAG: ATP-binding protein, partial [Candidatus Sumerlaeota bacterium]